MNVTKRNYTKPDLKLTCACGKCHKNNNEKINKIKSLDMYFKEGDKRRGEALVLCAEAFLLGEETAQQNTNNNKTNNLKEKPTAQLDNQQVIRRNNGDTMSDATSTGNNDSDEIGCSEDLSQPADDIKGYIKTKEGLKKLRELKI